MGDFDLVIILTTFGLGGVILLSLTLMNKVTFFMIHRILFVHFLKWQLLVDL